MSKRRSTGQRADSRGKEFCLLPHVLIDSDAWQFATTQERSLVIAIFRRFNGSNNGAISYSAREAARDLVAGSNKSDEEKGNSGRAARLLKAITDKGFIAIATYHPKLERKAREYRLTFVSSGERGQIAATNDYLDWKLCADTSSAETWKPADTSSAPWKQSADDPSAATTETCGVSNHPSADVPSTLISYHSPTSSSIGNSSGNRLETRSVENRADDPFMQSDELRAWVLEKIDGLTGIQTQLANAASVPAGTLSKFLHRGRGLPRDHRVSVQQALPRLLSKRKKITGNGAG